MTIPHPAPALFPGLNPPAPAAGGPEQAPGPHRFPPFSNRRLEQLHADGRLSHATRGVALALLRLPTAQREAEYARARSRANGSAAGVQVFLEQAAQMHELDKLFAPTEPPRNRATYTQEGHLTVECDVAEYDLGHFDADGGEWQQPVDDLLQAAGFRRVGPWVGDTAPVEGRS